MAAWPGARATDGGIDNIPLHDLPYYAGAGELWLAGKHAVGADPVAAMQRVGITTIVCLTERHELSERYPDYVSWLDQKDNKAAIWHPIPDLHAPSIGDAQRLCADLMQRLAKGERLLIHCAAGFGRTGTLAACLLITLGATEADALALIAHRRPMAGPEVGAQRNLVRTFAERALSSGGLAP